MSRRNSFPFFTSTATHLCPLLWRQTVRGLGRHHAGASPLHVPAVVAPVAIVEEQHVVVGDPRRLVQALEVSTLVVGVDLTVLYYIADRHPRGYLPP